MIYSVKRIVSVYFILGICIGINLICLPRAGWTEVKFTAEGAFDRIYFQWPVQVGFSSQRFGTKLLLQFKRAVKGDVESEGRKLGKFIKTYQLQEGGKEAVIAFTGKHKYKVYRKANKVILDVGPGIESKKKTTALKIQDKAKGAVQARVSVRFGKHKDYQRVVFDWSDKTLYSVKETPESVSIKFNRFAKVNEASIKKRLPSMLSKFSSQKNKNGHLAVNITKPKNLNLRHSVSGNKIIFDFLSPKPNERQVKSSSSSTAAKNKKGGGTVKSKEKELAKKLGLEVRSSKNKKEGGSQESLNKNVSAKPAVQSDEQNFNTQKNIVKTGETAQSQKSKVAEVHTSGNGISQFNILNDPKWSVDKESKPLQKKPGGQGLNIRLVKNNNVDSLRFEWSENVPSAIFTRAGYLWVVFDKEVLFDFSNLVTNQMQILGSPEQLEASGGSVFRSKIVDGISASVWRDGNTWVVDLAPQLSRPDVALKFVTQQTSPQGPRVFVLAEGIGDAITLRDPEVGDRLFVVPILPLSRGIEEKHTFAQFNLLQSTQGIVVQPLIDELEVRVMPDGVALTASQFRGLEVSDRSKSAVQKALSVRRADGLPGGLEPGRIFNLDSWRQGARPREFLEFKQKIQHQISQATSIARSGPRLSLAQFYFAKGLSAETMGLLRTISNANEELSKRPDVIGLRGASQFILGRFSEAEKELDDRSLNGFSEAELWRGAANAAQGKWAAAIEHFARAGEIPGDYPRNFSTQLALWAAEAAIRAEDYRGAGVFLDAIADGKPTLGEQARLNYLRGRVLYASNDTSTALSYWRRLIDGPDRWARVRAKRALIEHDLQTNVINRIEAIENLEQLRFAWRGDQLEFDLLKRLGELYLEEKDYVSGLTAMRQAVTFFPNNVYSRKVSKKMMNSFSSIYTDGTSDSMTPLTALSMYDQFRELTPVGRRGDRIIQRLADRLVEVDLLDRASVLLDRQVRFRLQGKQKAKVGSKLALIRLLDRQPATALEALDESVAPGLDNLLALERKRLRSRSVFELGDSESALKLIRADKSRKADLLRADIYWRTQEWKKAAVVFRRLIGDTGKDGRRLSDLSATLIVNWAVALSMSEQKGILNEARQAYAAMMDATRYREAFRLITNKTAGDLQDFRTLTERFQEIGRFQAFLTSYREKLKDEPLSKIN